MNNKEEKLLMKINEKNIFYRIKKFIKKIFIKNEHINYDVDKNVSIIKENKKEDFLEYVKNIKDAETKILKLQKQFRSGQIKEEELTQEQIILLCNLYDKQIANLKKSNKNRKNKIIEHRKKQKN